MARPRKQTALERSIQDILAQAAREIAAAVRHDLSQQLQQVLGRPSGLAATGRRARGAGGQRHNVPPHCIHPGCTNPSKGPRFSFMCDEHKSTPKAEKRKYLDQWKAQNKGEAPKKAARGARKRAPKKAAE